MLNKRNDLPLSKRSIAGSQMKPQAPLERYEDINNSRRIQAAGKQSHKLDRHADEHHVGLFSEKEEKKLAQGKKNYTKGSSQNYQKDQSQNQGGGNRGGNRGGRGRGNGKNRGGQGGGGGGNKDSFRT